MRTLKSTQQVKQIDLQGAPDLTSWTRPVRQNLHAGDPRQLHLEVTLAVQEQISGGESSALTGVTGAPTGCCLVRANRQSSGGTVEADAPERPASPVAGQDVLGRGLASVSVMTPGGVVQLTCGCWTGGRSLLPTSPLSPK